MPPLSPSEISIPAAIGGLIFFIIFMVGISADIVIIGSIIRGRVNWGLGQQRLKDRPWSVYDGIHLLAVIGTMLAALVLIGQITNLCGIVPEKSAEPVLLLIETLLIQGGTLITIEYLRRRNHATLTTGFLTKPHSTRKNLTLGLFFYLAIIPPVAISALLSNELLQFFNIPVESQEILKGLSDPSSPFWLRSYLILMAVVFAPLLEELTFRGIALPLTAKHASPILSVIAVSVLFAFIHGHLPAFIPLFLVAVGFSSAYIYTGSILVPITMHALFNGVNLIVFFLHTNTTQL